MRGNTAVWALLLNNWRSRWRSLVVPVLMVGLVGGVSLAAVAGARRSASSLERFEAAAGVLDVFIAGSEVGHEPQAFLDLLESPQVQSHNDLSFVFLDDTFGLFFAPTSRRGMDVERGVLLAGRRANPDEPSEVVLTEAGAQRSGLGVGDTFASGSLTPEQAGLLLQGQPPSSLDGPALTFTVVGVVRTGFDLGNSQDTDALTMLTPAFLEKYGGQVGVGAPSHMVRLAGGPGAVGRFSDAVNSAYGAEHLPSINVGQREATVADSIAVITAALVAVALAIAIAGLVWIASVGAREMRLAESRDAILRALGATPADRRIVLVGGLAPALFVGPVLAAALAVALSPAFPVGVARHFDPDLGFHFDGLVIGLGVLALALALGVFAVAAAARIVSKAQTADSAVVRVPRRVERAAKTLPPAAGTGVRFALYAPRRVSAPVRPGLIGAIVGVVGLVAVVIVGASLQRLVDTPARWGTTWDVTLAGDNADVASTVSDEDRKLVRADDAIDAAAVLLYDEQVTVNGVESIAMTLEPVKGALSPTIVEGREPQADDEIALARDTFDAVANDIGAQVTVGSRSHKSEKFRIVGVIAFPAVHSTTPVATGAALTASGGQRLSLGDSSFDDVGNFYLAVRWVPGADTAAALQRLGRIAVIHEGPVAPPEVSGLREVRGFPFIAGAALALIGSIATTHALLVTVRRRRLELGVLSAMGFVPTQRRAVIVVQATSIAIVALLVGMPLGAVTGRVLWAAIAHSIGVASDARFPFAVLAVGAIGLVLALNLIAAWPAHTARRLRIAEALRSE